MHLNVHLPSEAQTAPRTAPKTTSKDVTKRPVSHHSQGISKSSKVQETAGQPRTAVQLSAVHFSLHPAPPEEHTLQRLEALVGDFIASVRRECVEELASDPKALRAVVLRLVRRSLPLRRGRPNDPRLDAAMVMLEQGKKVSEILRSQSRGFDRLDNYGRYLAEKGLRAAISRRRRRIPKA
jgi:hypothetical protein